MEFFASAQEIIERNHNIESQKLFVSAVKNYIDSIIKRPSKILNIDEEEHDSLHNFGFGYVDKRNQGETVTSNYANSSTVPYLSGISFTPNQKKIVDLACYVLDNSPFFFLKINLYQYMTNPLDEWKIPLAQGGEKNYTDLKLWEKCDLLLKLENNFPNQHLSQLSQKLTGLVFTLLVEESAHFKASRRGSHTTSGYEVKLRRSSSQPTNIFYEIKNKRSSRSTDEPYKTILKLHITFNSKSADKQQLMLLFVVWNELIHINAKKLYPLMFSSKIMPSSLQEKNTTPRIFNISAYQDKIRLNSAMAHIVVYPKGSTEKQQKINIQRISEIVLKEYQDYMEILETFLFYEKPLPLNKPVEGSTDSLTPRQGKFLLQESYGNREGKLACKDTLTNIAGKRIPSLTINQINAFQSLDIMGFWDKRGRLDAKLSGEIANYKTLISNQFVKKVLGSRCGSRKKLLISEFIDSLPEGEDKKQIKKDCTFIRPQLPFVSTETKNKRRYLVMPSITGDESETCVCIDYKCMENR